MFGAATAGLGRAALHLPPGRSEAGVCAGALTRFFAPEQTPASERPACQEDLRDRTAPPDGYRKIPATQPVIAEARVPAAIERMPSAAISPRREGAIPPMPPIRIASEPKFAKPQSP